MVYPHKLIKSCFLLLLLRILCLQLLILLAPPPQEGHKECEGESSRSHSATNGLELWVEGELNKFRDPSLYKLFGISDHYPFGVLSQVQSQIFGKQVQCTIQNAILDNFKQSRNFAFLRLPEGFFKVIYKNPQVNDRVPNGNLSQLKKVIISFL